MRRIITVSAAVLLLLGGCGRVDDSTPEAAPSAGNVDEGAPTPETTPQAPPPGLSSGIVFAQGVGLAPTKTLIVRDVATGNPVGSPVVVPYEAASAKRTTFDKTMNRLTYVKDCELRVATLTDGVFTDSGTWTAPQVYGAGEQCYQKARFTEDGRIHAVLGVGQRQAPGSKAGRVVSVDPATPDADPKDEGVADPRSEKVYKIDGLTTSDTRVYAFGDDIEHVLVNGAAPGAGVLDGFEYHCGVPVDADRFLCSARTDETRQHFGSIALVTVDRAASTVTMKKLAPPNKSRIQHLVLSPDGKMIAIQDSTGWYTTTLDGAGTPVRQQFEVDNPGEPLFWS
ncbi:hypothetical protein [Micromonospora sp. SH-82]|uniref:hypothetical protein n=1 Tax=Micromonospora sp. SH-82 TaxID=3132938 RepID=UPI003EBD91FA